MSEAGLLKGGAFLLGASLPEQQFIPEEFDEEQRMIRDMGLQFIAAEITPILKRIDQLEEGLMPSLLDKAGILGLLGAAIPEEYGGLGKDFVTATLINEALGGGHSFSVAMAAHTGIGTLPILYFGTPEQKQMYIPRLASGNLKGAYALTEPDSGSDALGARTTARLDESGIHYLLNGQKSWITNSGFADIFTVFAKIDGEKFTAFIVEKGSPGLSLGEEEHKMGIRGSSTRQVFFQNCQVPAGNLLGEIGKGHLIAFNILNIGRLKLCAGSLGAAKQSVTITVRYANARRQFGQAISSFGAIKYKLAEQALRLYACESALYRTARWIDDREQELLAKGLSFNEAQLGASEEYAIECAILKIAGSEVLDYVVDEGVQVHGGNGYSEEYDISRSYRDSRINRIFEGTNEINRLLILDMLLKRAGKGRLGLMEAASGVQQELLSFPETPPGNLSAPEQGLYRLGQAKKALLATAGAAVRHFREGLEQEQEVLMSLADMVLDIYLAESALLRVTKRLADAAIPDGPILEDLALTFLSAALERMEQNARQVIVSFAEGDELKMMNLAVKRFIRTDGFNTKEARRRIAARLIQADQYCF